MMDIKLIANKHFELLIADSSKIKIYSVFIIIPLIFAIVLALLRLLTQESVNTLVTAFAIFSAILPNVIFIQFNILKKETEKDQKEAKSNITDLAGRLYVNSIYAFLIAIITLIALILFTFISSGNVLWHIQVPYYDILRIFAYFIYSVLIYFFVVHFLLNLVVIVRRLYILLYPDGLKVD